MPKKVPPPKIHLTYKQLLEMFKKDEQILHKLMGLCSNERLWLSKLMNGHRHRGQVIECPFSDVRDVYLAVRVRYDHDNLPPEEGR